MDCSTPGSSVGFPKQEYWSRLLFPSPGDLTNPGIEPESPALAGIFFFFLSLSHLVGGSGLVLKLHLTLTTLWTVAHQAPLSMGYPRQEYWSGWPFPSP